MTVVCSQFHELVGLSKDILTLCFAGFGLASAMAEFQANFLVAFNQGSSFFKNFLAETVRSSLGRITYECFSNA